MLLGRNSVTRLVSDRWHLPYTKTWYMLRYTSCVDAMMVMWLLFMSVVVDRRPDV